MLVGALCPLSCLLVLYLCVRLRLVRIDISGEIPKRNRKCKLWTLRDRMWRASFACPLNDHTAALVFEMHLVLAVSLLDCLAGLG